jgi:hypothetical protein
MPDRPEAETAVVNEQEVLTFVATSLRSVWALEVALLLRRERSKPWPMADIIRETRTSENAVADALSILKGVGLVSEETGLYRYWPSTPKLEALAAEVEALYASKPATVIKAILAMPDDKLRTFSDAFKLKE